MFTIKLEQEKNSLGTTLKYGRFTITYGNMGQVSLFHNDTMRVGININSFDVVNEFKKELQEYKDYAYPQVFPTESHIDWIIPERLGCKWRLYIDSIIEATTGQESYRAQIEANATSNIDFYRLEMPVDAKLVATFEGKVMAVKLLLDKLFKEYEYAVIEKLQKEVDTEVKKYLFKISIPEEPIYWEEETELIPQFPPEAIDLLPH